MTVKLISRGARTGVVIALIGAVALIPSVASGDSARASSAAVAVGKTHQSISGAGSSWSSNAIDQWTRNVAANYGWTVHFDNSGSSAGRQQFTQGTVDFAVSEIPYNLAGSDSPDPAPPRQLAYIPIVAGGTAFMYNLAIGGQRVTNLRLSGEVVAKIFTGVITKWNDPAIAADNPKLALPALAIVPVVRSDGSGTTAQLTSWMRSQFPAIWSAYCQKVGKATCGITSNYPVAPGSAFLAQSGSNGVAGFVASSRAAGAITYVEESYALQSRFPVAKVLNAAGYYTEPTASNVAVSLLAAAINTDPLSSDYLTSNLSGVYSNADPRTYPLSSYSYMIIPTAIESRFTEDKGLTLADFASYFLCEGQQQMDVLGYSPLPVNLATAGLEQIQKIPGGDPINKSIATCNNPTFTPDGSNKLANEAPQPQACDKVGSDQCLTGTGGASETVTAPSGASSNAGSGDTSAAKSGAAAGAAAPGTAASSRNTSLGSAPVGLISGGTPIVAGSPFELPPRDISVVTLVFMILAVMAAVSAVLLPPVIARRRAAAVAAGLPRGSRKRKTRPRPRIGVSIVRFGVKRASTSRIHLHVPFRKRARAVTHDRGEIS